MTTDPRLSGMATWFRAIADMIDAGTILDAAAVATPKDGDPYMHFAVAPRKPELLAASLQELAGWVSQTEKNAAIEQARDNLLNQVA